MKHTGHGPRFFALSLLLLIMLLVFASFVTVTLFPKASTPKTLLSTSLLSRVNNVLPTTKGVIRVMPLGDSITMGANSPGKGGYRVWLWNECKAAGLHITFVGSLQDGPATLPEPAHEGHSGWRIDHLAAYAVPWLKTYQPQVILLHIGTNDILQGYGPVVAAARLSHLIDEISATLPDAMLFVAQITPLGTPHLNVQVQQYNAAIPVLVRDEQAQGMHVAYVDMYDAVPVNDITDKIHPNEDGYIRIAGVWFRALEGWEKG